MMRRVPRDEKGTSRSVLAWSLYDLANTVFFLLVATRYFPEHLATRSGGESMLAWASVPAMLAAAILSPSLGAVIDAAGGARRLTLAFTLICCGATLLLAATDSTLLLVIAFAIGRFAYEMAAVPYNALLPSLTAGGGVGRASGLGVSLGYLGNVLALGALSLLGIDPARDGYGIVYGFAALLFLLFSLPMLKFVDDLPSPVDRPRGVLLLRRAIRDGASALRRQLAPRGRRLFFLGVFFACDAVNTVLVQVARYAAQPAGLGFEGDRVNAFLIGVQLSCILGGLAFGRLSDWRGGRLATLLAVAFLFAAFSIAEFAPNLALRVGAIATLGGAGLAGIWAASRHWLVELVPRHEQGEAFGVFGLVQRASLLTLWPFAALYDRSVAAGAPSYSGSVALLLAALLLGAACFRGAPARAE
jgi:UMF1 family MFS transporter